MEHETPLADSNNGRQRVRLLLGGRANIIKQSPNGSTTSNFACTHGLLDEVKVLMEHVETPHLVFFFCLPTAALIRWI